MFLFRISEPAISKIILEVCQALMSSLRETLYSRHTRNGYLCLGALDGKHCIIQAPINSCSDYFNYKNNFSIVMIAIADANYNFIYVDVGSQGHISDGGVFRRTELYNKLHNGDLNLPPDDILPGIGENVPYVFFLPTMHYPYKET
ncbi:hypothetical protein PR048_018496 [Dryococelus australis]|uniref:DDE Tnp4 domain-containing protein n=1 Tax=Dryococelus australis TaxID=614101 RepID=A0ABQ9HD58_9NEOP|nr:hypothetical protein PR048_018496 [Dryococelus australis]